LRFLEGLRCAPREGALAHFRITRRSIQMMDVVVLAIGFVFFALSIVYVYACDRL
jgi:hypothetical protein